jgi:hypothetical protein
LGSGSVASGPRAPTALGDGEANAGVTPGRWKPLWDPKSRRKGSGRPFPGPEGDGKASAAELLRPRAAAAEPSGLAGFLGLTIAFFLAIEGLSAYLPTLPTSGLERWLVVGADHPLRSGLALAFLWRALRPPRRGPT